MRYSIAILAAALLLPFGASAAEVPLQHIRVDVTDKPALQRGAKYFVNYCLSCHSAKYERYSEVAQGLGISQTLTVKNLIFTGRKFQDTMIVAMPPDDAKRWFGVAPPDLTEIAHIRGADWIYTYLKSFYLDKSRPFGVNNLVFPNVSMPHVLWMLQGWQVPVYKEVQDPDGQTRREITDLKLAQQGQMTPAQYDQAVHDLVTFLVYISEPYALASQYIGAWAVAALVLFTVLAYLLKREYWKDVH